jgi:hypothetical protein
MDNVKRGSARSPGYRHRNFFLSLALLAFAGHVNAANGTMCATDQLDWYTSVIGESPCRTYERLRQICDQNCEHVALTGRFYTDTCVPDAVGAYNPNTPLNVCDSQQTSCCCNSIAWNLAMLCLKCADYFPPISVSETQSSTAAAKLPEVRPHNRTASMFPTARTGCISTIAAPYRTAHYQPTSNWTCARRRLTSGRHSTMQCGWIQVPGECTRCLLMLQAR